MDAIACSIHALIACFSWSSFYVDGGIAYQDRALPHQVFDTTTLTSSSVVETIITQRTTEAASNPYGRLALGYELQFKSLTLAIEASHVSSLDTDKDDGINSIGIKAHWYPFKH